MSDPRVLFSLVPLGERAIEVVNDSINEGFVSYLGGHAVLDIGRCLSKSGGTTLATLGRDGDIAVRGSSISRIQCSFEINSSDNIVMFVDRSRTQSSQVFGDNATPFEYPRDRQIAVLPGVNNIIGMGGVGRDLVLFHLQWNTSSPHEAMERVKNMPTFDVNWRLVQTMINEPIFPSQRATRIHTSRPCLPKMRTVNLGRLGAGAFGEVDKVVDLDSGRLMAAKSLKQSPAGSEDSLFMQLKREVENLAKLSHPNIVGFIASEGWDSPTPKIFMGLQDGSLHSLVSQGLYTISILPLGELVLHHMLQALDYLATQNIVHLDVKPENILYTLGQNQPYHFRLGDFGLSQSAITLAGTPGFMAPELHGDELTRTFRLDIWSLYVTMIWTWDIDGYRLDRVHFDMAPKKIAGACIGTPLERFSAMGRVDAWQRASAAQMLIKCFDGQGLSTPRHTVLPLPERAVETCDEVTPEICTSILSSNQSQLVHHALDLWDFAIEQVSDEAQATSEEQSTDEKQSIDEEPSSIGEEQFIDEEQSINEVQTEGLLGMCSSLMGQLKQTILGRHKKPGVGQFRVNKNRSPLAKVGQLRGPVTGRRSKHQPGPNVSLGPRISKNSLGVSTGLMHDSLFGSDPRTVGYSGSSGDAGEVAARHD